MKTCFKCHQELPVTEFYPHPAMGDGYLGKCKSCAKVDVRANYARHRSHYHKYEQLRNNNPDRRAAKRGYCKNHRAKHRDKARARYLLGNAVRDGRLIRLGCKVCGDPKTQAHHNDYSKPLDVRWLCFKHHREHAHGQVVTSDGDWKRVE